MNSITSPSLSAEQMLSEYKCKLVVSDAKSGKVLGSSNITQHLCQYDQQVKSRSNSIALPITEAKMEVVQTKAWGCLNSEQWNKNAIFFIGRVMPLGLFFATLYGADYLSDRYLSWDQGPKRSRNSAVVQIAIYILGVSCILFMVKMSTQAARSKQPVNLFLRDLLSDESNELLDIIEGLAQSMLDMKQSEQEKDVDTRLVVVNKGQIVASHNLTSQLQKKQNDTSLASFEPASISMPSPKRTRWHHQSIRVLGLMLPWVAVPPCAFLAAKESSEAYLRWSHSQGASENSDILFAVVGTTGMGVIAVITQIARKSLKQQSTLPAFCKALLLQGFPKLLTLLYSAFDALVQAKQAQSLKTLKAKKIESKKLPSVADLIQRSRSSSARNSIIALPMMEGAELDPAAESLSKTVV